MANWQRTINIAELWQQDDPDWREIAREIARQLREMIPFTESEVDETRTDLEYDFRVIAEDESCDVQDFDSLMEDLYNWGDTRLDGEWNGRTVCWINTISI